MSWKEAASHHWPEDTCNPKPDRLLSVHTLKIDLRLRSPKIKSDLGLDTKSDLSPIPNPNSKPHPNLSSVFTQEDDKFKRSIRADAMAVLDRDPACRSYLDALLYFKGQLKGVGRRVRFRVGIRDRLSRMRTPGERLDADPFPSESPFHDPTASPEGSTSGLFTFLWWDAVQVSRPCRRTVWPIGSGGRAGTPWPSTCRARSTSSFRSTSTRPRASERCVPSLSQPKS